MSSRQLEGERVINDAEQLILDALAAAPEGLTNAEVARATGLDVPVSHHLQYITWSLLRHLVESGRAVKEGRRYRPAG